MAASFLFLLLVAPALVMSDANVGKFVVKEARSVIKESAKDYMQQMASQQGRSGQRKDGQQDGSDTVHALVFDISVGTSPQTLSLVMDITDDLVWAQCERCPSCVRFTPPDTRTFLPNSSDSFRQVACASQTCQRALPGEHCAGGDRDRCNYVDMFIPDGNTSGYLATDTFSFGAGPVPGVVFGCSGDIIAPYLAGASGFAGFSRAPLSLVSQLNISRFAYFIAPPGDATGKSVVSWSSAVDAASLESAAEQMLTGDRRSSTPLLSATAKQDPHLYYVNLTGIQLDGQLLTAIPAGTLDVRTDGSGGAFLSTTLPITYLPEAAYRVLRRELVSKIQSQGVAPLNTSYVTGAVVDQLCYHTPDLAKAKVPVLSLVFDGADVTMELKVENYFFNASGGQLTCLMILPSAGGTVLGSLLQAGRTMTYDIDGGRLMFQTVAAGARAPERVSALVIMVTLLVWVLAPQSHF